MTNRSSSLAIAMAAEFSRAHPIETTCQYYPVCNRPDFIETKIRSSAWVVGGNQVIVKVEGRSGGVSIYHLTFEGGSFDA